MAESSPTSHTSAASAALCTPCRTSGASSVDTGSGLWVPHTSARVPSAGAIQKGSQDGPKIRHKGVQIQRLQQAVT